MLKLSDLRKRRREDEDLWPISLADMMTLLLCFFLLVVAVSHVDLNRYERVADSMQKAMAPETPAPRAKPANPAAMASKKAPEPVEVRSKVSRTMLRREPVPAEEPKPAPEPAPAEAPAQSAQPAEPATPQSEPVSLEPRKKTLEDIKKELTAKLAANSGEVELTPRQDSMALNLRGAAFFDLASAEIKPQGMALLRDIAASLAGTPYKVTVEGHTDNLPIESWLYPSNWELSSARASRVARLLIDQGMPRDRMRVEGLADTQPVAPNTDAAGRPIPENQAKNRRVVILVSP